VNTTGRTIIPFQQFALIAPDSIEVVCRLVSVSLLDQVENPIGSVHNDLILAARARVRVKVRPGLTTAVIRQSMVR
jgi:hypothetical protein